MTGPDGRPAAEADRSGGAVFRLHRGLPPIGPGSLRLGLSTLARPRRHTPLELTVGWLPRGVISTDPIRDIVRRTVPSDWVEHPGFWAVACDYATGRRVAFGRPGAPGAELADAVAASCAIPGFYRPVDIGGRRYVDGGVRSTSNLDLLAGHGLDLVICLNPTSTRVAAGAGLRGVNPLDRVMGLNRAASGRRLGSEAKRVRAGGSEVVLIQPTSEDLAVIGNNLMSGKRRNQIIDTARRTVARALNLAGIREHLSGLPGRRAAQDHPAAGPARPVAGHRARTGVARPRGLRPPGPARRGGARARGSGRLPCRWRRDREERATGDARRTGRPERDIVQWRIAAMTSPRGLRGWATAQALIGRAMGEITKQIQARVPKADLDERDPDYIRDTLPRLWLLASLWFRGEVRGLERIPAEGPVLLVGNHSGGNLTPDTGVFTLAFNTYFGVERRFYQLAHNLVLSMPGLGFLRKYGTVAASPANADQALASGAALLVYPGGDYEVHRPSWDAGKVDFDGRKGFLRLALQHDVPIVPVVSVGGQETALFLSRGEGLAKAAAPGQDRPAEGAADLAGAALGRERGRHVRPPARAGQDHDPGAQADPPARELRQEPGHRPDLRRRDRPDAGHPGRAPGRAHVPGDRVRGTACASRSTWTSMPAARTCGRSWWTRRSGRA